MKRKVAITESEFQRQVSELAWLHRWQVNHVRRTIGKGGKWCTGTSVVGWPDLTLWKPGRFLVAELKTDKGKLTAEQMSVLDSLRAAGVEVHVWRPRDWDKIVEVLSSCCVRDGGEPRRANHV